MKKVIFAVRDICEVESHPKTKKVFRILLLSFFLFNTLYMMTGFEHFFGEHTYGMAKLFDSGRASDWFYFLLWNPQMKSYALVFLAAHLVTLVMGICGIGGRLMLFAAYFFTVNILNLNLSMLDGGHNMTTLLFLMLCLMNTSGNLGIRPTSFIGKLSIAISNAAFLIARLQVVTLYLTAVLHKLQGHLWTKGVALYYILQSDEFQHPYWSKVISRSDFAITVGTYFTLAFQMAYPALIWFRKTRPVMLIIVIGFHLSTIYIMGLTTFGIAMFVANFLFFKESWTEYSILQVRDGFGRIKRALTGSIRTEPIGD